MSRDPTAPLSSRLLDIGHGLIVAFPHQDVSPVSVQGVSSSSVEAFFFKVLKWHRHFREYRELDAIDAGPANALDYGFLGEDGHSEQAPDPGPDVLRLVNDDLKVYHLGFAPRDPNLRVYEQVSAAAPNRAVDHNNRGEPDPTAGDDFGFYTSREIGNVFDPPALTERLSFRNDESGEFLEFGFFADGIDVPDGGTDLIITGRTYQLQPITDPDEQEFMLNQFLLDREDQTLRTIAIQVGGLFSWELGSTLPNDWQAIEGLSQDVVLEGLEPPGQAPDKPRRQLEAATPRPPDSPTGRQQPPSRRR